MTQDKSTADSYNIKITTETSEVDSGLAKVDKKLDTFEKKVKTVNPVVDKLGGSLKNFVRTASGAFTGLLGVGALIVGARTAIAYSTSLKDLSEALDVDIEKLSVWGDAVKQSGGSAEGFQETVKRMAASLEEFATKGKSRITPFFGALGIKMTNARGKARDFLDILPELATKFEGLSKQKSFGLGQKLGLDTGTIQLLQKGRAEVDKVIARQKALGVITKKDAAAIAEFNDQAQDLSHIFRTVSAKALGYLLPVLKKILIAYEAISNFAADRKEVFIGAIIGIGTAISAYLLPPLIKSAIAATAAFAPFFLLAGILTAVGAAIGIVTEDIDAFLKGNKSLTGYIIKNYPTIGKIITGIIAAVSSAISVIKAFGEFLFEAASNPQKAWVALKKSIKGILADLEKELPGFAAIIEGLGIAFAKVAESLPAAWDAVYSALKKTFDFLLTAIDAVGAGLQKIAGFFGGEATIQSYIKTKNQSASEASKTPFVSSYSRSIVSQATNNSPSQNVNVSIGDTTIKTPATDAKGIASGFADYLTKHIQQANGAFDNGVAS